MDVYGSCCTSSACGNRPITKLIVSNDVPGFRVKPFDIQSDDDVPAFRVKATEDVPGFRVPSDGSPPPTFTTGGPLSQGYVSVNSTHPYLRGGSSYLDATPPPGSDPERRAWVLGILMGLVLMVAMLQVWRYWNRWAWGWVFLFSFVVAPLLYLPRKRPTAKTILIALSVGTYLSLLFH